MVRYYNTCDIPTFELRVYTIKILVAVVVAHFKHTSSSYAKMIVQNVIKFGQILFYSAFKLSGQILLQNWANSAHTLPKFAFELGKFCLILLKRKLHFLWISSWADSALFCSSDV